MSKIYSQIKKLEEYGINNDAYSDRGKNSEGQVFFCGGAKSKDLSSVLPKDIAGWQLKDLKNNEEAITEFSGTHGPIWVLRPQLYNLSNRIEGHDNKLNSSPFGLARDLLGQWVRENLKSQKLKYSICFLSASDDEIKGALVGVQLARYNFLEIYKEEKLNLNYFEFSRNKGKISNLFIQEANALGLGQNIARHLGNLPASDLNPKTFAELAGKYFSKSKIVKADIWDQKKLEKEKMGLLLGVGNGSVTGSRLVHLKVRSASKKPVAFVGKGVTFDTGGLDIKPSSNMRLMKKDMCGAGVLFGLAAFIQHGNIKTSADFYLSLAENAISDRATRPGDVHQARNGKLVEIHNTDAEGRLVMADALDVAVTQKAKDQPECVIDVSTLTGAMRVAVGIDIAGYFSNDDQLAKRLEKSAQSRGEMLWRMPLIPKYFASYNSKYADFMNASDMGFGGAISAAMFLQKFVGNAKWAHFDMMAWNMVPDGALCEGANAQTFSVLAGFLSS